MMIRQAPHRNIRMFQKIFARSENRTYWDRSAFWHRQDTVLPRSSSGFEDLKRQSSIRMISAIRIGRNNLRYGKSRLIKVKLPNNTKTKFSLSYHGPPVGMVAAPGCSTVIESSYKSQKTRSASNEFGEPGRETVTGRLLVPDRTANFVVFSKCK